MGIFHIVISAPTENLISAGDYGALWSSLGTHQQVNFTMWPFRNDFVVEQICFYCSNVPSSQSTGTPRHLFSCMAGPSQVHTIDDGSSALWVRWTLQKPGVKVVLHHSYKEKPAWRFPARRNAWQGVGGHELYSWPFQLKTCQFKFLKEHWKQLS